MVEGSSTQPDSKESSETVEAASTPSPDNKEISEMVEASSTQTKSSEMVEASSTQPDGQEVSDEMVEAASAQPDGKESSEMDEDASTQPDGKESTEMVKAASTESDIQTEKLDSKGSSEMVKAASTEPDNEGISELKVKASVTQPDSKESNEMVKAGSSQPDSQGVSDMVEGASTQSNCEEMGKMIEAASDQSDRQKKSEIVGAASTQPDGKESNEMVKAASTQSDIQITIEKNRKRIAEKQDEWKEKSKNMLSEKEVHLARYRLLVRAIFEKNVKAIEDFINENLEALLDAHIDDMGSTIFHLIVQVPGTDRLIEKLVAMASPESLARRDINGDTALHLAALFGNTKAVKLFLNKNTNLLTLKGEYDLLPVDWAIDSGRYKEAAEYLLSAHAAREKRFDDEFPCDCAYVLYGLIEANHIDLAFRFLNQYPKLADRRLNVHWDNTINELATKDMELPGGTWRSLIYHYIPVKAEKRNSIPEYEDIENQIQTSQKTNFFAKLHYKLWNALSFLGIKRIHDQKFLHEQTLEIVRLMIVGVTWSFEEALESLRKPMLTAATLGNHRFVEEILKAYNYSFLLYDEHGHTIFHLAVLHRQENVFNLIHDQISFIKEGVWRLTDDSDCNILHLAGRLVPSNKVPGAALQMQRELQWFKTVEDMFNPKVKAQRNVYKKTPREVFTEEHKILVKEGEKWMKETATACSVVAALIITVVFATAYTFPGGLDDKGVPKLLTKTAFKVFLVSIGFSLFSSIASVQMFLGILTSRYAEEDFHKSLPQKLIIGLITLFFSIASMMVAFASTFHIYIEPWKWARYVVMAVLVFVPITLFAFAQFRLLVDIVKSTYGPSIFRPLR